MFYVIANSVQLIVHFEFMHLCMCRCTLLQDMKRHGGPNKLRKKCRLRQCRIIKKVYTNWQRGICA